ncbi:neuropeptide Y receptor type 6-like [Oculina patagonica]
MSANDTQSKWQGNETALIILQVFYGVFFVIGILKNALALREIIRRKGNRKLTTNQLLMVHLAMSDILILLTLTPAVYYADVDNKYTSHFACHVMFPMAVFYPYLRVFTQVVIAIERRRAIVTPLKPRLTKSTITIMLSLCWLLSAVFTAPVMLDTTLSPLSCGNDGPSRLYRRVFYTLRGILQFFIPLVIIAACYIQAGMVLKKSRIVQFAKTNAVQHEASRQQNVRVCKAFSIMVLVFAICSAPLNAICLWVEYRSSHYEAFETKAVYCFVANFPLLFTSFLDPIIYGTCCHRRSPLQAWRELVSWKNKTFSHITCCSKNREQ